MRRFVSLSVLVVAASASIATSKKKTLPKADVQIAGDLHVPGEAQVDLRIGDSKPFPSLPDTPRNSQQPSA